MSGINRRTLLAASALSAPALAFGSAACASREPTAPSSTATLTGADILAEQRWSTLSGRRVGIVTNPTGILSTPDSYLRHIVDDIHFGGGVDIVGVFGPEHGFRGTAQAGGSQGDYRDPRTGLPVYDTYGAEADEIAAMFTRAGVEQVVYDIADVGARFYTYIWTMYLAMQAAAKIGASFVVLDRPNPIGDAVAGPRLDPRWASFVGLLPIVQQHGMTAGELARLFDQEYLPGSVGRTLPRLDVVTVRGWSRNEMFPATGLPWVPPSPNIPTPQTTAVYPGTGLFEGTLLSEGRGAANPFEIIGAPGIDWRWAEDLNNAGLAGVRFRETYFVPTFSKHQDRTCGGVQLYTSAGFEPVRTAIAMIVTAHRRYPQVFGWRPDNMIDKLFGSDRLRTMVDAGANADDIVGSWHTELADFRRQRQPYLLYR